MPTPPRTLIVSGTARLTTAQSAAVREYIRMAAYYGSPAGECLLNDDAPTSRGEPAWTVTGPHDCDRQRTAKGIRDAIENAR